MRLILIKSVIACSVLFAGAYACKKKKSPADEVADNFDRSAMLTNMGNTIILPAYTSLAASFTSLDSAVTDFNTAPDATKLLNLQELFKKSYRTWQTASTFKFGPASDIFLNENTNTFPTSTTKINANINSGSYNLDAIVNLDTKGLPAIDYLLFGIGADNAAILAAYTTDSKATNRKAYLIAVSRSVKTNADNVLNAWLPTGGNYIGSFISANGTDVGSSLSQFVNQLDYDLEVLKNFRLGLPLGKLSMGTLYPEKVEAYYCGISSELALIQLQSLYSIYQGKTGLGLDDYLVAIDAKYNGQSLNDAINTQFTTAISKLQLVPDPLSATVTNNAASANDAYTELQKLVVLLKTDMSSALGILITYEDNDGD